MLEVIDGCLGCVGATIESWPLQLGVVFYSKKRRQGMISSYCESVDLLLHGHEYLHPLEIDGE